MCVAPLFLCDSYSYLPAHVLAAASVWGRLDAPRQRLRRALAALQWGRAGEYAVEDSALQEASEAFRRAHGLRSSQSTQAWLEARSVSIDDFGDYLERRAFMELQQRVSSASDGASREEEIAPLLWPELVFSGEMAPLCRDLAGRVAVAAEAGDPVCPAAGEEEAAVRGFDARFAQFTAQVVTPARLESALRSRWGELFRVDCELARFAQLEVAREVRLCVAEDEAELLALAQAADGAYQEGEALLSALPAPLRAGVQAAGEGTLLPVISWDDGHVVCRVRAKYEPSLLDGETRARVERAVVEDAVAPALVRHITWVCEGL
jgi:hypothetical protein